MVVEASLQGINHDRGHHDPNETHAIKRQPKGTDRTHQAHCRCRSRKEGPYGVRTPTDRSRGAMLDAEALEQVEALRAQQERHHLQNQIQMAVFISDVDPA